MATKFLVMLYYMRGTISFLTRMTTELSRGGSGQEGHGEKPDEVTGVLEFPSPAVTPLKYTRFPTKPL